MDLVDFVIFGAFSHQRSGLGQDLAELCFCLCFLCLINYQAAVHCDCIGIIPIFLPKNGLIPIFRSFFTESDFLKIFVKKFNGNSSLRKRRSLKEPSQPPQKEKENPEN